MRAPGSNRWKVVATCLGVLLAITLVGGAALWFRVTANVDLAPFGETNMLDAKEAKRKLRLLEGALASGQSGFIRLSKIEANSLIDERFRPPGTNAPPETPGFVRCRIDFGAGSLSVVCWMRYKFFGRSATIAWERTGTVVRQGEGWQLVPTSMRLGSQPVPQRFWKLVESRLGSIDAMLAEPCKWLDKVPTLQFTQNELSQQPELRFYTYADTNLLTQAKQ